MTVEGAVQGGDRVDTTPPGPFLPFPIVGIGASAGGLEACLEFFEKIPRESGMAFVVIQHLGPSHPSYLREALAKASSLPVELIEDGMRVEPDHVYVIPPDQDVGILNGALALLPRSSGERQPHLPIDFFFRALAAEQRNFAIGIILSGSGSDGSEGLRSIKDEGGIAFAQEPASAKFAGMPESALRTGVVDLALPVSALAEEVVRMGRHPMLRGDAGTNLQGPADDAQFKKIFILLRNVTGVDFSQYKAASVRRRLVRRLALHRLSTSQEYLALLRENAVEARTLSEELLIHVTSFFRDGEALDMLKADVFPQLLRQRQGDGAIRVWVAGCATGEEAYSLAIVLHEFLAQEDAADVPVQLFATDVSASAIERARAGVYSDSAVRDVSPERLATYFHRVDGGYRISKTIRERCAFVKHDLARDPPFSRLGLVTCRNVLIYFGPELQKRVLSVFQFALNRGGVLMLGSAEDIAVGSKQFSILDRENKTFTRTEVRSPLHFAPILAHVSPQAGSFGLREQTTAEAVKRADGLLLERYSPAGVLVNERMDILQFRGRTGPYLEPAPGHPRHDLLRMARRGLSAGLRIAISEATRTNETVRRSGVSVEQDDGSARSCDLVVIPVSAPSDSSSKIFAVLFEEAGGVLRTLPPNYDRKAPSPPGLAEDEARVERVEAELKATTDHLQAIVEEHQRTNEELVAANEELVSTNEEQQSLNEELETAKEELQASNEELRTLNEELQARNSELDSANNDLVNVVTSVDLPLVIVDVARRIRRFTPKAKAILNLLPADVGRPLDDIRTTLSVERLDTKIAEVIETLRVHEEEVLGRDQVWFRLQIRPYLTLDKRIDGAVISVVDIDYLKRALGKAEWARDYAKAAVEALQMPLLILGEELRVVSCNESFHQTYAVPPEECHEKHLWEILSGTWDSTLLRSALADALSHDLRFDKLEIVREVPKLGTRHMLTSGRSISIPTGGRMVLLAIEDVTERLRNEAERARLLEEARAAEAAAGKANDAKDAFLAILSHELRTPLSTVLMQSQVMRQGSLDEGRVLRACDAIERAAKVQAGLIDDLLDVSRIIAGKLKMEQKVVGLAAVVHAAVSAVAPAAEKHDIALELALDAGLPPVLGDPMRLQQVVMNLLTNAIKFTPRRGRVTVGLSANAGWAHLRVTDTGVGIDPAFLPHVFERFIQEDHRQTRSHGGLGLGLSIVRYLIDAHGGTIRVESAGKGLGSSFTISLRLLERDHVPAVALDGERTATSTQDSICGTRMLIVEDDEGTRDALREMLQILGAAVHATASAKEAMDAFEEFKPQVLLCDIAMPVEDGYSLLARVRALGPDRGGNVPAVALTALASSEDRRHAMQAGFQLHLTKPIDIDRLASALQSLLAA